MARIAGIDIPKNKRGVISLTYIFGIGNSRASKILDTAGVDHSKKVSDWTDAEVVKLEKLWELSPSKVNYALRLNLISKD